MGIIIPAGTARVDPLLSVWDEAVRDELSRRGWGFDAERCEGMFLARTTPSLQQGHYRTPTFNSIQTQNVRLGLLSEISGGGHHNFNATAQRVAEAEGWRLGTMSEFIAYLFNHSRDKEPFDLYCLRLARRVDEEWSLVATDQAVTARVTNIGTRNMRCLVAQDI